MFSDVTVFRDPTSKYSGSLYIKQYEITFSLVLQENGVNMSQDLDETFVLTPMSDPYIMKNGYHLIDLSFYSDFTLMKDSGKVCFHDSSQDSGVSICFANKSSVIDFVNILKETFTLTEQDLPGLFKIARFFPLRASPDDKKKLISQKPTISKDQTIFLERHAELTSQIMCQKTLPLCTSEAIDSLIKSKDSLRKFIQTNRIPANRKAEVWCILTDIGVLPCIDRKVVFIYEKIYNQWSNITFSQSQRCSSMQNNAVSLGETIVRNQQRLFTVVPDFRIIKSVYNIIMSVCQVYNGLNSKHSELFQILRVFLSMFVKSISHDGDELVFHISDSLSLSKIHFEAAMFWSLITILEKGEAKYYLLPTHDSVEKISEPLIEYLNLIFPDIITMIKAQGPYKFGRLLEILSTYGSSVLPLCDCSDVWLSAISSSSMIDFFESLIVAGLVFQLPSIYSKTSSVDLGECIIESLLYQDHSGLIASTQLFLSKRSNIFRSTIEKYDK